MSLANGDFYNDEANEVRGKPVESADVNRNKLTKEFKTERRKHQNRRGECYL